ncbi:MAG: hypothetical protein AAGI37_04220 [Planctomycetota bacterium]
MKAGASWIAMCLSAVSLLCGIVGMIVLMATRRGGSLLTWQYFVYVFQYASVLTLPFSIIQFFIHRLQMKRLVGIEWVVLLALACVAAQFWFGYFVALAFDF